MPSGFECFNPTSTYLQVSSAMISHFLRKSGSGTVQTNASPQIGATVPAKFSISVTGYSAPIVAVKLPGYTFARASYASLPADQMTFGTDAPVGTAYSYYVFDAATTIPSSTMGIECFNDGGSKSFSRTARPMLPLKLLGAGGSVTFTGRTLAIGISGTGRHRQFNGYDYYVDGVPVPVGDPYNETGYQDDDKLYGALLSNSNQTAASSMLSFYDVYYGPGPGDVPVNPSIDFENKLIVVDVSGIPANTVFF